MKRLFSCEACGFLSTLGSEFEVIDGVPFDKGCADSYRQGVEPVRTWVEGAIERGQLARHPKGEG